MNVATISMPRAEARHAYLDHRQPAHQRRDTDDAEIAAGYRHLS